MESNNKIKPTIEWMSEKYDEMNTKLFNGKLDACDFEIFTSGKGSQGRTLGHFCLCSPGLKIKRNGGRMYKPGTWENNYEDIFINADNFYNICHPKIGLNGNYSATEDGWLNTLIHEMCHYYTYMDGWAPKQAHGWEFRNIAYTVSSRSGGLITITRLASAEKMENFELDAEIQQKNKNKLDKKFNGAFVVFVFKEGGFIEITIAKDLSIANTIVEYYTKWHPEEPKKIELSRDPKLIEFLRSKGFTKICRSYRYWTRKADELFGSEDFLSEYEHERLYTRNMGDSDTDDGQILSILETTIDKNIKKMFDDGIEISPNMNLGLASPMELL